MSVSAAKVLARLRAGESIGADELEQAIAELQSDLRELTAALYRIKPKRVDIPDSEKNLLRRHYRSGEQAWIFRYRHRNRQREHSLPGELSVEAARIEVRKLRAALKRGVRPERKKVEHETLGQFWARYLQSADFEQLAAGTKLYHERSYRRLEELHDLPIAAIEFADVYGIVERYRNQPAAAGLLFRTTKALLSRAVDLKVIETNPLAEKRAILKWLSPRARTALFSLSEIATLFHHLDVLNPSDAAIKFAGLTGARIGEVTALRVEDVAEDSLLFRRVKQGGDHRLPLTEPLRAVIAPHVDSPGRVFARTPAGVWKRFTTLQRRLHMERRGLHVLRASFSTHLREHDAASPDDIRAVLGHSERSTLDAFYLRGDQMRSKARVLEAWQSLLKEHGAL